MKNNFSKQWDAGGGSQSIIQSLNLFTSQNLFKSLKSILMVVALLSLSSNVWGESPATGSWNLTSSSTDWSATGNETYFSQPYGYKKANGTLTNTNVADFTSCASGGKTITSIKVGFKGLRNGNTVSKITISLVDKDGNILTSGTALELTNASAASNTAYVYSTFTTGLTGATGFMMKVTTFGKNVLINGASYEIEYEETSADPVTSLILSEAGIETDYKSEKNVGDSYPLPSTTEAECGDKVLVGWSTVEITTPGAKPISNFYAPGTEVTLAENNTFYAVFADASSGGTVEETVDICSIARTTIAAQATPATVTLGTAAYQIEGTPISLTATKGTNNWPVLNYHATNGVNMRFYKTTSTVTFTAASPSKIKRVEFLNDAETTSNMTNISATGLSGNVWSSINGESSVTFTYSNSDGNYTTEMWIINVTYTTSGTSYSNYTTTCGPSTYTPLFSELLLRYFPAINVTVSYA